MFRFAVVDAALIDVHARNIPNRRLLAASIPASSLALADRVPTGLVLPVVVAAPHNQSRLAPDNLRADHKVAGHQALADRRRVHPAVPDVGDSAREQRPGLTPVRPVVVQHPTLSQTLMWLVHSGIKTPSRVVVHAIRRIGHHQVRLLASERALDHRRVGAVAAGEPVPTQQPDVAETRDRVGRRLRCLIRIGQPRVRRGLAEQFLDLAGREAGQAEIEARRLEVGQFKRQ